MKRSHRATLERIFEKPTRADIKWRELISFMRAQGALVDEARRGSRVGITLHGNTAVIHKPHPRKELKKGAVEFLREFLEQQGIRP